jgi:hypothetical protein
MRVLPCDYSACLLAYAARQRTGLRGHGHLASGRVGSSFAERSPRPTQAYPIIPSDESPSPHVCRAIALVRGASKPRWR